MELGKHEDCQTPCQFSSSHSLKLVMRFLPSLFFFSVIVSWFSPLPVVSNLVRFFNSNIDKNYMFLLCNGILVLIVKNSGLMWNSHEDSSLYVEGTTRNGARPQKLYQFSERKAGVAAEEKVFMEINKVKEIEAKALAVVEGEIGDFITLYVDGEHRGDIAVVDDEDDDDEEEGEEPNGLLSAEELNKKCDDFIRKMREEIRFEAQQVIRVQV